MAEFTKISAVALRYVSFSFSQVFVVSQCKAVPFNVKRYFNFVLEKSMVWTKYVNGLVMEVLYSVLFNIHMIQYNTIMVKTCRIQ